MPLCAGKSKLLVPPPLPTSDFLNLSWPGGKTWPCWGPCSPLSVLCLWGAQWHGSVSESAAFALPTSLPLTSLSQWQEHCMEWHPVDICFFLAINTHLLLFYATKNRICLPKFPCRVLKRNCVYMYFVYTGADRGLQWCYWQLRWWSTVTPNLLPNHDCLLPLWFNLLWLFYELGFMPQTSLTLGVGGNS